MKRCLTLILALSIFISTFACFGSITSLADSDTLTAEQLAQKNYPLPEGYEVSTLYTMDNSGCTDDGCYYDTASNKIVQNNYYYCNNFLPETTKLDGEGFMFWYKSDANGTIRIRANDPARGSVILETDLLANPDGGWAIYYFNGQDWSNNLKPKSDAAKDIRPYISDSDNYYFTYANWGGSGSVTYFDEFYTFKVTKTVADTYDNDNQAFKFSRARFEVHTTTHESYSDDGSVELTSTNEDASYSPINVTYNADSEQFAKAVAIAKQGSGYLQIKVDNITCHDSNNSDAYAYITVTFNGIDKKIAKYSYGSGTSDIYLLDVSDLENPEDITTINVSVQCFGYTTIKDVDFKFSPIEVFNLDDGEIIVQAEDMNPQIKLKNGDVSDADIVVDDDKNRTYVAIGNGVNISWLKFDLPELEVGEYDVYACVYNKNINSKYIISVNNIRQTSEISFKDSTYTSARHISNISLGTLTVTKNYSDGKSEIKFSHSSSSQGQIELYLDYLSFKKTDTSVSAEPSSNFVIKDYPEMEDYEVKTVLDTFDDYVCATPVENNMAGYVGDGNAYNLNSKGTAQGKGGDGNGIWSGSLDGDGLRFWYKSSQQFWLRLQYSGGWYETSSIPANTSGTWYTVYYDQLRVQYGGSIAENPDIEKITSITLVTAGYNYFDELHTVIQKEGDLIYSENADGTTASVSGYRLRLEDVEVASAYNEKTVTTIANGALSGSKSLKSVKLPDTITTIGENAFKGCTNLGDINIPSSVTSIGANAFSGCSSIILDVTDNDYARHYAIDNSINYHSINADYEYYCIDGKIQIIKYIGSSVDVTIPETIDGFSVTSILEEAFKSSSVQSVSSSTVTTIKDSAFEDCTALSSASFTSVLTLGDSAFANCTALSSVQLGNSITTIGKKAFANNSSLKRIALPETLTSIASDAFENIYDNVIADVVKDSYAYTYVNTKATAMVQIPDTDSDYKYSLYRYEATVIGYEGSDKSLNIPEKIDGYTVVAIGKSAFESNTDITYVAFPDKCKNIYDNAFKDCSALSGFDINNMLYIGHLAFAYTGLTDITLTNIVQYEDDTFKGCNINISTIETQFTRSALELTNSWHVGINFGNIFEWAFNIKTHEYEEKDVRTYSIPTRITKERIDFLHDSGFDVLRFPITWLGFVDDSNDYKIDDEYLSAIKDIVDYAINDDMYIVINVHHDTLYWLNLRNYSDETKYKFQRIWEQIAEYFKDYDEHLIFESFNEERYDEDWDGNTSGLNLHTKFNDLQKLFYNTVRNSGGNNAYRYLMFETYAAQAKEGHCQAVWVPSVNEDDHVIMSVHHYDGRAADDNGEGWYYNAQLSYGQTYFIDNGIPYILGEAGCPRINLYDGSNPVSEGDYNWNQEKLVRWTNSVFKSVKTYNSKVLLWEDAGTFGMISHNELAWDFPDEIAAIMANVYPQYTLTVDSEDVTVSLGKAVLPENDADNFVCYTDGENYYFPNEELEISKDTALTSVYFSISMIKGASFRINEQTGIRFYTNVDIDLTAKLREAGFDVSFGTLITPSDILGDDELTLDFENSINVEYKSDEYYKDDNGFEGIVGSIVNIKESNEYNSETGNIKRSFVGRGYVTLSKDGYTKTIYASYFDNDITNNTRTINWLAQQVRNNSEEYNKYTSAQKAIINRYADF